MKFSLAILKVILLVLVFSQSSYSQVPVPYVNYFESASDTAGWSHYATLGTDDWALGYPSGTYFTAPFSGDSAWKTTLSGNFAASSTRYLETPEFDLTNTSVDYAFTFQHKRYSNLSSTDYIIEYSIDNGVNWFVLYDAGAESKNWQPAAGYSTNSTTWKEAVTSLSWLQGQMVKFRFKCLSTFGATGGGFMIDDFKIQEAYYNVTAVQEDTIKNINKLFTQFTLNYDFNFNNQYSTSYPFLTEFYFSEDEVLDVSDPLIGSNSFSAFQSQLNQNKILPLPPGLSAGNYYVFFKFDVLNSLAEADEMDNINFAVLEIDSIYVGGYSTNFDSVTHEWTTVNLAPTHNWNLGDPDEWHLEDARSGENAWMTPAITSASQYIESPYMDLTSNVGTTICFWYRNASQYPSAALDVFIKTPLYDQPIVTFPAYSSSITALPNPRHYFWDCYCQDISAADGEQSTKVRITGFGDTTFNSHEQTIIDDIYIGEAKPDAAIQGFLDDRFTSSAYTMDTLAYLFFNSGLDSLVETTTNFYWSTDSLYDVGDVFLGAKIESGMSDTTFEKRTFDYIKPILTSGTYYIIYKLDANNDVDEMREYDNLGYFKLYQLPTISLPYLNDFESSIVDWRHRSTLGNDDWAWGVPQGVNIDTAFSGTQAFVTNLSGDASLMSRMHLFTPIFDLTQLDNPVLEFDISAYFDCHYSQANIMYSTDGGYSWILLDTTNQSYKGMYYMQNYGSINGSENITYAGYGGKLLYGSNQLKNFRKYSHYQGRDYDEITHFAIDLEFLNQSQQVQFMFVYANHDLQTEGMMIDNFSISESKKDLLIPTQKNLMVNSSDAWMKFYFDVKNNNNYLCDSSTIDLYCSIDNILDASDTLFFTSKVRSLMPFEKQQLVIIAPTPLNYGNYNYILYDIDPDNLIAESNEFNNTGNFSLGMDSCENYTYPILFDFEADFIDGWTWYHDSTASYHGHRFRHKMVVGDPVIGGQSGEWFLDPIDQNGYSSYYDAYPVHFIESPAFDFTDLAEIEMSFDFRCYGGGGFNSQGGNMEYSTDGGVTWNLLSLALDPNAVNWYNIPELSSLNDEPGWHKPNWTNASFDLTFLAGEGNVRLRYKFRSEYRPSSDSPMGFRLDNFHISALSSDLKTDYSFVDIYPDLQEPAFYIEYKIENTGNANIHGSNTKFYWSENSIFDAGDILLYDVPEVVIMGNSINLIPRNIYYPHPLSQNTYYLFYVIDADGIVPEISESNNVGSFRINFDLSQLGSLDSESFAVWSADGEIILSNRNSETAIGEYKILDAIGQVVQQDALTANANSINKIETNTTLETGIYYFMFTSGDSTIILKFFYHE